MTDHDTCLERLREIMEAEPVDVHEKPPEGHFVVATCNHGQDFYMTMTYKHVGTKGAK